MPIFKDRVALEACPAKTAESVSYGVAFTVLGWLLVSNYAVLGSEDYDNSVLSASATPAASSAAEFSAAAVITPNREDAEIAAQIQYAVTEQPSLPYMAVSELESRDFLTSAPLPLQLLARQNETVKRSFDLSDWQSLNLAGDAMVQMEDIVLPRPSLALDYLIRDPLDGDTPTDLASMLLTGTEPLREITVTNDGTDTLSASRVQIPRPQIPRSYRAQEVQRSLVLPPRIQALKP